MRDDEVKKKIHRIHRSDSNHTSIDKSDRKKIGPSLEAK